MSRSVGISPSLGTRRGVAGSGLVETALSRRLIVIFDSIFVCVFSLDGFSLIVHDRIGYG